eukprot:2577950-Rhodomonas_salina.1
MSGTDLADGAAATMEDAELVMQRMDRAGSTLPMLRRVRYAVYGTDLGCGATPTLCGVRY